jgi:two-component system, cell cycle response regulator DivK
MKLDGGSGGHEVDELGRPLSSSGGEFLLDRTAPVVSDIGRAGGRRSGLILIADDTFDTRELYSFYLIQCGFSVKTVTDGEAAVQTALESLPDVIVLDLSMPRVDGIAATKRIRAQPETRHIPVIVVTGFPHRAAQRDALEAGADVFLGKPCLPEDLARQVQRLIARSADKRPNIA